MKHMRRGLVLCLLLLVPLSGALAAPTRGISTYLGLASHSSKGEFTSGSLDGESFSITGSGLSIGIDYQLPLSDNLSINFLLMGSNEEATSKLKIDSVGHGLYGVEGRYWSGDFFAGLHLGWYTEAVVGKNGDTSTSINGAGMGYGFSAGWAQPGTGVFILAQYDNASIAYSDARSNLTGMRAHTGYRWSM